MSRSGYSDDCENVALWQQASTCLVSAADYRKHWLKETRMTGAIKKLYKDKKFGFIVEEKSKVEYFFHASGLKNAKFDDLGIGQEVTFEDVEGTKGPRAEEIYV